MASWRSPAAAGFAALELTQAPKLPANARLARATVQGGSCPVGTLLVVFDLADIIAEREHHIGLIHTAILIMLLIGMAIACLSAAYAVRRLQVEATLRRTEAGVVDLLESLPDAAVVHRRAELLYANPAFRDWMEAETIEELHTVDLRSLVHPEDREAWIAQLDDLRAKEQRNARRELRLVSLKGTTHIVSMTSVRFDFDGQPAVATIARDLTQSKKVQAQLAFADRMMSVGTLAAGMAHEVNNPLTFVVGNLDLLAKEVQGRDAELASIGLEDLPEIIEDAIVGAQRVRRIIGELKTFSGSSGDDSSGPIEVNELLDASLKMAAAEIRHRANLVRDYGEVPAVTGNESSLCQVFLNLIVNAAHAMDVGHAEDKELRLVTRMQGDNHVAVEVRDSGAGIPAENIPRLFDPFFTTKAVGEGTGLGLSICHNIISDHGGTIEVSSEVGQGTVFTVILPVAEQRQRRKRLAFAATGRYQGASVLVIDDEKHVVTLFRRVLAPRHRVVGYESAKEALELLLAGEHFDVIFCDVMMPDLTGIDLHAQVVAERPELKDRFVFITGGAFTKQAQDFLEQPMRSVLRKPFTPAEIKASLAAKLPDPM